MQELLRELSSMMTGKAQKHVVTEIEKFMANTGYTLSTPEVIFHLNEALSAEAHSAAKEARMLDQQKKYTTAQLVRLAYMKEKVPRIYMLIAYMAQLSFTDYVTREERGLSEEAIRYLMASLDAYEIFLDTIVFKELNTSNINVQ